VVAGVLRLALGIVRVEELLVNTLLGMNTVDADLLVDEKKPEG
jgi:hypothetical protein